MASLKEHSISCKPQIIIPLEELNASGGIRIISEIANLLVNDGFLVRIIVPQYASKEYFRFDPKIDIKLIPLKKKNNFTKLFYLFVLSIISAKDGSIIVASTFRSLFFICISKYVNLKFSKKVIHLIQGLDKISLIQRIKTNFCKKQINLFLFFVSKYIDKTSIAVSSYVRDNSYGCRIVINNFVDIKKFYNTREILPFKKSLKIGTVSSLVPNKGFDFFINCCCVLQKHLAGQNFELEMLCATQDEILIERFSDKVKVFKPETDFEMNEFYNSCDIFFSTSFSEGFGLPVLEAMACGCLVISTNSGGILDFLRSEHNGLLLKERDELLFLNLVVDLLHDPEKAVKLRKSAIQTALNDFDKNKFSNAYASFFKEVTYFN